MKKILYFNFFLFIFLIFSIGSIFADLEVNDVIPDFSLPYYVGSENINLSEYFSGADFYCIDFDYNGTNYADCIYIGGINRNDWEYRSFSVPNHLNLTFGFFPYWNGSHYINVTDLEVSQYYNGSHQTVSEDATYIYPVTFEAWCVSCSTQMVSQIFMINNSDIYGNYYNGTTNYSLPIFLNYFSDYTLNYDDAVVFSLNDYFTNYERATILFQNSLDSYQYQLSVSLDDPNKVCEITSGGTVCLESSNYDIYLSLYSSGVNSTTNIDVNVFNGYNFIYDDFNLFITDVMTDEDFQPTIYPEGENSFSFIAYISSLFNSIFPNYTLLNSRSKFSYVIITLLIINLLGGFLYYKTNSMSFFGSYSIITNILFICYFIAIHYIPLVLLILVGLIALATAFIKFRSGI